MERCFDRFIDFGELSIADYAKTIYADRIDILIDLKGYTRGTRTEILTYRPAPIQVNYLGYPGALGGDFCDYIITDNYVTLPAEGFVFCCFNQAYKIMPEMFDLWRRLLYNTPGSVLWLLKNSQAKSQLRNEVCLRG